MQPAVSRSVADAGPNSITRMEIRQMQRAWSRSMIRGLVVGACIVALGGCVSARKVYTPTGTQGYSITCSGNGLDWGKCYEKAGELCGERGYEIIERTGDQGAALAANRYGAYGSSTNTRNMIIECNQ